LHDQEAGIEACHNSKNFGVRSKKELINYKIEIWDQELPLLELEA
jgi:hypothetical protein